MFVCHYSCSISDQILYYRLLIDARNQTTDTKVTSLACCKFAAPCQQNTLVGSGMGGRQGGGVSQQARECKVRRRKSW